MDGLSAVCPARTADDDKFWHDYGLPAIETLLGPLGACRINEAVHYVQSNVLAENGASDLEVNAIMRKHLRGSCLIAIAVFSGIPN